jgi:hypothetical protein
MHGGASRISDGMKAAKLVVDRYFERYPERRGTALERHAYINLYLNGARLHLSGGEIGRSVRQLLRAARHNPLAAIAAISRFFVKAFRKERFAPSRK